MVSEECLHERVAIGEPIDGNPDHRVGMCLDCGGVGELWKPAFRPGRYRNTGDGVVVLDPLDTPR